MIRIALFVGMLFTVVGCGSSGDPPQPKMTEEKVKSIMEAGKAGSNRERADPVPK